MTKSVSGRDVEDMLSSVRRLVSSELPRNRRTNLPEGPGALVLTDAQRIETSMIGHNSPPKSLEDRIAELEAAVSETADDWEPDGSEDQDQHRPDRIVYKPSEDNRKSDRPRSLRLSEIALIETGPANDDDDAELSEPVVATATFRHESDSEPLSLEEDMRAEDVTAPEDEVLSDPPNFTFHEDPSDTSDSEDTARDEIISEDSDDANIDASFEPPQKDVAADANADEGIATDEAFEDALAEAVAASLPEVAIQEIEQQLDRTSAERVNDHFDVPDAAENDKTSLQPLVASLIREELQGELGERITRNVRKLVRQEIQRALAVRELE